MTDDREPTTDEAMGVAWWNGLIAQDRATWMQAAGNTGVAADAWAAFKNDFCATSAPASGRSPELSGEVDDDEC